MIDIIKPISPTLNHKVIAYSFKVLRHRGDDMKFDQQHVATGKSWSNLF